MQISKLNFRANPQIKHQNNNYQGTQANFQKQDDDKYIKITKSQNNINNAMRIIVGITSLFGLVKLNP